MAKFNFNEEDLLNEEKKKKKQLEEKSLKVKEKVENNWNNIFNVEKNEQKEDKNIIANNNVETAKNESITLKNDSIPTKNEQESVKIANVNNQEINKEKNSFDTLKDKVKEIEEQFNYKPEKKAELNEDLNLTKKEYVEKSEEELNKEAEKSLRNYKTTQLDSIDTKFENTLKSLNDKQTEQKQNAENEKAKLNAYYESAKENAENDALKRGLQRSSIVINNLNAFDKDKVEKLLQIDKELTTEIDNLNKEIENLNQQKEQAVADFNLEYALKVSEKITELQNEIKERNEEITEYNNKIAQIEAEFKNKTQKENQEAESDYLNELIKYGENKATIEALKNDEINKLVNTYLESLTKEEALNELQNNPYFKELLGTNFSHILYKTNQRTN